VAALLHRGQAERQRPRISTSSPTISWRASTATWSASTSTSPAACAPFINRKFGGRLAAARQDFAFSAKAGELASLYEQREFGKALRKSMALADAANQFVDEQKAVGAFQAARRGAEAAAGLLGRDQSLSGY